MINNPRHEKFAQLIASGKYTQTAAYREVYPSSRRWKDSALYPRASHLNDKVLTRVQELQRASAEKVIITKAEALNILAAILKTPVGELDDRSLCAQRFMVKGDMVVVEKPSIIAAYQELAKSLGWYLPEKQETEYRFKPDAEMITLLQREAGKDA